MKNIKIYKDFLNEEYSYGLSINNNKTFVLDSGIAVHNTMGGHSYVYPNYISENEIWIDEDMDIEDQYTTIIHEMTERNEMRNKHLSYSAAHDDASAKEKKIRKKLIESFELYLYEKEEQILKNIEPVNNDIKKDIAKEGEDDWVYLIHHMHPPETKNVKNNMEILHHCPMFEEKDMKGKKYAQMHIKCGKMLLHALDIKIDEKFPTVLYDHLNNEFPIEVMEIEGKKYAIITKPTKKLVHDEYEKK